MLLVSFGWLVLAFGFPHAVCATSCLSTADQLNRRRHLYFGPDTFPLRIAETDDPVHKFVNQVYTILARERLGYQDVEYVHLEETDDTVGTLDELKCDRTGCTTLPNVHLNLLFWLPAGTELHQWTPPSVITDCGRLGPVRQWQLRDESEFADRSRSNKHSWSFLFQHSCPADPKAYMERVSSLLSHGIHSNKSDVSTQPFTIYKWVGNDSSLQRIAQKWVGPSLCSSSEAGVCRTESYSAVKIAWANFTKFEWLHRLASRMYLGDYKFDELRMKVAKLRATSPVGTAADSGEFYHDLACSWLRRNPSKWMYWTEGWNAKTQLVMGFLTDHTFSELAELAIPTVKLLNTALNLFGDTDYELLLRIHEGSDETVLHEYINFLMEFKHKRLLGTIATINAYGMESVVMLGGKQKTLVISPTLSQAQFLKHRSYPYFFRLLPSMTQANFILLRLFLDWNWHRFVAFVEQDRSFFKRSLFNSKGMEVLEMMAKPKIYQSVLESMEKAKGLNHRIFLIDYEAEGTYNALCAAYHLGMTFDAGYVFFINPVFNFDWWDNMNSIESKDCTPAEVASIGSSTFTLSHQGMLPDVSLWSIAGHVVSASQDAPSGLKREKRHDETDNEHEVPESPGRIDDIDDQHDLIMDILQHSNYSIKLHDKSRSKWFQTYTTDAIVTLGSAVLRLLRERPWVLPQLDQVGMTDILRDMVASTNFENLGLIQGLHQFDICFNSINERVSRHWLLKQTYLNTTLPVILWSIGNPNLSAKVATLNHGPLDKSVYPELLNSIHCRLNDTLEDLSLSDYAEFERHLSSVELEPVKWGSYKGPVSDGRIVEETCAFPFLSQRLRMGCTGAVVFVVACVALLMLLPVSLAGLYYRRKLQEAEFLTRKPFEELCAELADLDIAIEAIVLNRHIGQGAFGLVFGGEVKTNGTWEAVAVKVLNEKATYEGKIDFLSEAKLMRSLKHRNVVRLIGISLNLQNTLYLLMELMLLGDLKTYLLSRRILAKRSPDHEDICPRTLTNMSMDIAEGVRYLHSRNLIHRDIACRNCLVASDYLVKIGDFGLTREKTKNRPDGYYRFTRNCELPIRWMSPEAVQFGMFSVQSDIWSYGITLYEIVTFGVFPYSDLCDVEVVERVKRREFSISDFLPSSARNTVVWNLIRLCCQHQFCDRPSSMDEVLKVLHDYPECVRPFLTEDPPKPSLTSGQTSMLQPPADASNSPDSPVSCLPLSHSFGGSVESPRSTSDNPVPNNSVQSDDHTATRNPFLYHNTENRSLLPTCLRSKGDGVMDNNASSSSLTSSSSSRHTGFVFSYSEPQSPQDTGVRVPLLSHFHSENFPTPPELSWTRPPRVCKKHYVPVITSTDVEEMVQSKQHDRAHTLHQDGVQNGLA